MLTNAYLDVLEKKTSVYKAAKKYAVPEQTLRDRIIGKVDPENTRSGPEPVFTQEEEARLVKHILQIAAVGYGYTRAEVINIGTEYAICIQKRDREHPLSLQWFYSFLGRWPELKVRGPKTITELRAKATSRESIQQYFQELGTILDKYNLKAKPECIYNVDEKGITQNHTPPYIVSASDSTPSVITSEKSCTTTILGCGNALGYQIPPYFVFAGARMRQELLEGCTPGTDGTVSQSGWPNSEIFQTYLQEHFIRFAKGGSGDQKILLLYDGLRSHISPNLIDWAVDHNIILYVLPPHTSHILQPMDVGCFGPFSKIYSNECPKFLRTHSGSVNRYNVCSLACKAYTAALSPANLRGAFRRSGIYPFDQSVSSSSVFIASDTLKEMESESGQDATEELVQTERTNFTEADNDDTIPPSPDYSQTIQPDQETTANYSQTSQPDQETQEPSTNTEPEKVDISSELNDQVSKETHQKPSPSTSFFKARKPVFFKKTTTKLRRSIHKVVSGKAITEPQVAKNVKDYLLQSSTLSKKVKKFTPPLKIMSVTSTVPKAECPVKAQKKTSINKTPKKSVKHVEPQPGPSGKQTILLSDDSFLSDSSSEVDDTERCCVCKLYQPKELKNCVSLIFTIWGQCMFQDCKHLVHLQFCCDVRVLRLRDIFYCPCHGVPGKPSEQ